MTKLYIANPKPKTEAFTYRVPDNDMPGQRDPLRTASGVRVQQILAGSQVLISGDLTTGQIDAIIDQHHKYGLYMVDDVKRQQTHYVGLLASVDKPVSLTVLESVMRANIGLLYEKGREQRKLAAISVNNRIESDMAESQMPGELTTLEMEVVEQRTTSSDTPETAPQRVRVTRDTPDAPQGRQRRSYNRKAA